MTASSLRARSIYEPDCYTNNMTMLTALIAKDGIAVASDGRSVNEQGEHVSDNEDKIFQLSLLCVILATGYIPSNLGLIMKSYESLFRDFSLMNVTDIANKLSNFIKGSETDFAKDKTKPCTFIVAGYDLTLEVKFNPHIYYLTKDWGWDLYTPKPNPCVASAGDGYHEIKKILEKEYEKSNKVLNQVNVLALKGVLIGESKKPKFIGGKKELWNIVPMIPIRKFNSKEITSLSSGVKL